MILVTGGSGYIGSHSILKLLKKNYEIISLDNYSNSSSKIYNNIQSLTKKKINFIKGDLRDSKILRKIFSNFKIEAVLHFAGLKSINESYQKPFDYFSNNLMGSVNLINEMCNANINKILFSSSATVYGNNHPLPWKEDLKLNLPSSPYAQTKILVEDFLSSKFLANNEWSIGILRYFNPVGSKISGSIQISSNKEFNNLIPSILKVLKNETEYLSIYGNDYDTHDGTGVRDYIHIDDLVDGHISALKYIEKDKGFNIWNLGRGSGYSVLEIVREFEYIIGKKIPYRFMPRRKGDISEYWADVTKSKKDLDWHSKKSLRNMVSDSLNETGNLF